MPAVSLDRVARRLGRVVVVPDAGWITNDVLADKRIGGVVIMKHDNWAIFRQLARWAVGLVGVSR